MMSKTSFSLLDASISIKVATWHRVGVDRAAGLRSKGAKRYTSRQQGLLAQYLSSMIRTGEQARAAAIAGRIPGTQHEIARAGSTEPGGDPDVIETKPLPGDDGPMRFVRDEAAKLWKAAP